MKHSKTNSVITIIANIHHNADKLILSELKRYNLTSLVPSHGSILATLYKNPEGVMLNNVSKSIGKNKSTTTLLISKLEKLGFIKKFKNETDRRSTIVKLTQKGVDVQPIITDKISSKLINKTYKNFTAQEKKTFVELLEKVKVNLEE